MRIGGVWLNHPGTQALCAVLGLAGHRILFVGGCVRNTLMLRPVTDIDLATDALPDAVIEVAETAGFRVIPTGIDHGTVTVIAGGIHHEITTFRRDLETDGRHALVSFSRDLREDAARRDFTMNALYAEPSGEIVDPLGGLPDLLAHRVRFVGEPEQRIREDYLRILRFFRFHAVYGDPAQGINAEGLAACAAQAEGVDGLSRERIGVEMRKLLAARNPAPALASMAATGVLHRVLPGSDHRCIAPLCHLEADFPPRWQRRLAVLGGEDPGPHLRLSRQEQAEVARTKDEIGSTLSPAALGWKLGATPGADVVLARAALLESPLPPGWRSDLDRGAGSKFPISAADLMPRFQGEALGTKLKELEARWLSSDLRLTRAALLA